MLGAFQVYVRRGRDLSTSLSATFLWMAFADGIGWSLLTIRTLWPVPSISMSNEGGEMSEEGETARRYRQNAARLRLMAEAARDRKTSETLKGVARDYELMAQVFDDIDHVNNAA